jgi:hypothetical protein
MKSSRCWRALILVVASGSAFAADKTGTLIVITQDVHKNKVDGADIYLTGWQTETGARFQANGVTENGRAVFLGLLPSTVTIQAVHPLDRRGYQLFYGTSLDLARVIVTTETFTLIEQRISGLPQSPQIFRASMVMVPVSFEKFAAADNDPQHKWTVVTTSPHEPLPDAQVLIRNAKNGEIVWDGKANDDGSFEMATCQPACMVTVYAPGYSPVSLLGSGSTLLRGDGTPIPAKEIPLNRKGDQQSSQGHLSELFSIESMRRLSLDSATLLNLPLSIPRNPDQLALLAPGVFPPPETPGRAGPGLAPGLGTAGQFSVNGLRSRDNNFTIDGSDYNDEEVGVRRQGFAGGFPLTPENLTDFHVITALPDMRFGRNSGGQVNALSGSAQTSWHGTLFGFGTDDTMRSRDFFDEKATGFPAGASSYVPITANGNFVSPNNPQMSFLLAPSYHGPIQVNGNGLGSQANPIGNGAWDQRLETGFVLGGPVGKLRQTFLFLSFDRQTETGLRQMNFAVPTASQRVPQGMSAAPGAAYPVSIPGDAVFSLYPFPNNPIGPYGGNTYTELLPDGSDNYLYSAKADRNFHSNQWSHSLSARYNATRESSKIPAVDDAIFSSVKARVGTENFASFFDTTFTPSLMNDFRFSFGRTTVEFGELRDPYLIPSGLQNQSFLLNAPLLLNTALTGHPTYVDAASAVGQTLLAGTGLSPQSGSEASTGPLGQVLIAGFSPVGLDVYHFPERRADSTLQFADTLTIAYRNHVIFTGFDLRDIRLASSEIPNLRPYAEFHGVWDPSLGFVAPVTLAAAGIPTGMYETLAASSESDLQLHQLHAELYVHDYYKLTPNLHINAGVRIGLSRLPKDISGQVSQSFSPTTLQNQITAFADQCALNNIVPTNIAICGAAGYEFAQAFLPGNLQSAFGAASHTLSSDFGFAWDLFGDGRTAIRGGAANLNGQFPFIIVNESRAQFPLFLPVNAAGNPVGNAVNGEGEVYLNNPSNYSRFSIVSPGTLGLLTPDASSNLVSLFGFDLSPASLTPTQPAQNLKVPSSFEYALSLEQQLPSQFTLNVAYVGTEGHHLLRLLSPYGGSTPALGTFSGPSFGPYPTGTSASFPTFDNGPPNIIGSFAPVLFASDANSAYESLQVEIRHADKYGIQIGLAFTYSHAIDDASDFFDTSGSFALPETSVGDVAERASSNFDIRLRSVAHFLWDVPGRSNWRGGWNLSGIVTAQTGQPYTVNTVYDVNSDGNATDRLDTTKGLEFEPFSSNPRIQMVAPTKHIRVTRTARIIRYDRAQYFSKPRPF